jgi:hypothetical protein
MLNMAVKAAASRDCSGKPFCVLVKCRVAKKLVAESPKPMLIGILKLLLLKIINLSILIKLIFKNG